jgi:thiol-disulfide isomerase/thioredoxin
LNYADDRLYKSGLFKDALEGHIWFIENSSGELEKVYEDMKQSIDLMVAQLSGHQDRFTEVTDFLFHLLEQRSLFPAAEHLAIKALEEQSCTLPGKLANQLEGYRKLKKGSTAPNISFCENTYFPNDSNPKDLKAFSSPYKLVVFAASWCTHCQEVMPKLVKYYPQWKEKGLDIVFVSLDDDLQAFSSFAGSFPFISTCDLKKWDGKAALDYHLFGTPTFYLLKDNLEIVLKPHSVEQIDVWVNYSLPKD